MSLPISSHSLTPLDHLLVPSYRSPVSTFDLKGKDRDAALSRLQVATTRLVSHLPFLGASIAPCADPDGRVNTFGVYSTTDDTIPFYELQEHAQSTPLLVDGDLNPKLMPSVGHLQPCDPCPVMRLKANVVGDMLYLVHSFYHRAMDGMSLSIVTKVLAQLCCDLDIPAKDLATSSAEQEHMRTHLAELGVSSEPQSLRWEPKPSYHPRSNTTEYQNIPVNRQCLIRAERIRQIQQACQEILQEHALTKGKVHLSTSLIMGAVFGICSHRARKAAGLGELYGSRFHAFFNIRSLLGLPSTYIGNALVMIGCSLDAQILPSIEAPLTHFASGLAVSDVQRVCNVALALLLEIQAYTPDHVAGMMGTLNTLEDWSSAAPPSDALRFSDMHKMECYYDFGPLGVMQDFALAEHKVSGAGWVLPDKPQQGRIKGPGYYDLQVGLERAAMEEMEKDQLFQWVTGTGPSKSKL